MNRRRLLKAGLLTSALSIAFTAGTAPGSWAQAPYPKEMVRIVVPFSGRQHDRHFGTGNRREAVHEWNSQVIVENRPGIAGTASVAKGPADGHTLMLTSNGHSVIGAMNRTVNFDPVGDFAGVTQVASMPSILTVPPEAPVKSLKELIEAAKAKPGNLNYASAGLGSATNIAAEALRQAAGLEMVHVPYKGMPRRRPA
jgi:tripartite-type tricarboxylate transporter receptor subunit TctC